jgi:hypothetical protein
MQIASGNSVVGSTSVAYLLGAAGTSCLCLFETVLDQVLDQLYLAQS